MFTTDLIFRKKIYRKPFLKNRAGLKCHYRTSLYCMSNMDYFYGVYCSHHLKCVMIITYHELTFPYMCKLCHIYRLSAYYGNLLGLSFEEASAMSGRFQSGLKKCCLQPQPECIIEEVRRRVRGGDGLLDAVFNKPQWAAQRFKCLLGQCFWLVILLAVHFSVRFTTYLMIWQTKRICFCF